jgi:hypothetical protein
MLSPSNTLTPLLCNNIMLPTAMSVVMIPVMVTISDNRSSVTILCFVRAYTTHPTKTNMPILRMMYVASI